MPEMEAAFTYQTPFVRDDILYLNRMVVELLHQIGACNLSDSANVAGIEQDLARLLLGLDVDDLPDAPALLFRVHISDGLTGPRRQTLIYDWLPPEEQQRQADITRWQARVALTISHLLLFTRSVGLFDRQLAAQITGYAPHEITAICAQPLESLQAFCLSPPNQLLIQNFDNKILSQFLDHALNCPTQLEPSCARIALLAAANGRTK